MARPKKHDTQSNQSFRDRIKELRRVKASELIPNPHNWHEHPIEERQDMIGVLHEIGYADAMLARELPDGRLMLLDGHMRTDIAEDDIVPVLIVDLTEQEAKQLIAVHDMIGKKARTKDDVLGDLLSELEAEDADMRRMLDEIRSDLELQALEDGEFGPAPSSDGPPEMELMPHEHYDYVVVLARNTHEWNRLVELLELPQIKRTLNRVGVARGYSADKLIKKLEGEDARKS
jgi:hypothetical protein